MDLKTYLQHHTQTSLAKRLGCSQGLISQWLAGTTRVSAEKAKEVEAATDGAVTRHELRPDIFDAPAEHEAAA